MAPGADANVSVSILFPPKDVPASTGQHFEAAFVGSDGSRTRILHRFFVQSRPRFQFTTPGPLQLRPSQEDPTVYVGRLTLLHSRLMGEPPTAPHFQCENRSLIAEAEHGSAGEQTVGAFLVREIPVSLRYDGRAGSLKSSLLVSNGPRFAPPCQLLLETEPKDLVRLTPAACVFKVGGRESCHVLATSSEAELTLLSCRAEPPIVDVKPLASSAGPTTLEFKVSVPPGQRQRGPTAAPRIATITFSFRNAGKQEVQNVTLPVMLRG